MRRAAKSAIAALVALCGVVLLRTHRTWADFYATEVYPRTSAVLSWLTGWIPFSLEEILFGVTVIATLACLVRLRRRWLSLLSLVLWLVVWFYAGWGLNYFRSSIFERAEVRPVEFEDGRFREFLRDYSDGLSRAYVLGTDDFRDAPSSLDLELLEGEVRGFYDSLPERWGLARTKTWQHPKRLLFDRLYSSVGVMGFVGPFFNEIQVGGDVPAVQYPFTYAHEYSHLLGVSSEAEANYWAWEACTASSVPAIRYSAYLSLLPYVADHARRLLPGEDYAVWAASLHPDALKDYNATREHWDALYSPFIGRVQNWAYNLYLKGNSIPAGTADYNGVIRIILSFDRRWKDAAREGRDVKEIILLPGRVEG